MNDKTSRFRHRHAWQLVLGMLCIGLDTPAWAATRLTLCFQDKTMLPWRTVQRDGLNFELLKGVEKKLGVTFTYLQLPWKRCLVKLKANQIDGVFSVNFSPERSQYGVFPGPGAPDPSLRMHVGRYFLVRKKGAPIDWDGTRLHRVEGKINYQLGYAIGERLQAMQVPVDETNDTMPHIARKLVEGRAAAAAVFETDVPTLMEVPLAAQLEVLPRPLAEMPYYLLLSRALVESRPALAVQLWAAIADVRNSRAYGKQVQAAGAEGSR
jgi:polar amino acid transport system substrate-binding protein